MGGCTLSYAAGLLASLATSPAAQLSMGVPYCVPSMTQALTCSPEVALIVKPLWLEELWVRLQQHAEQRLRVRVLPPQVRLRIRGSRPGRRKWGVETEPAQ